MFIADIADLRLTILNQNSKHFLAIIFQSQRQII